MLRTLYDAPSLRRGQSPYEKGAPTSGNGFCGQLGDEVSVEDKRWAPRPCGKVFRQFLFFVPAKILASNSPERDMPGVALCRLQISS